MSNIQSVIKNIQDIMRKDADVDECEFYACPVGSLSFLRGECASASWRTNGALGRKAV